MFHPEIKTTRQKRMAIKMLTAARRDIKRGHSWAVCSALWNATNIYSAQSADNKLARNVVEHITDEIDKRLGENAAYVTTWLREQPGVNGDEVSDHCQTYRQLWIKDMIREIKES